ncbi:MAG: hypothetical protein JWN24_1295 [Phycisphaerales bacterium]|nr:hypothetical protein [Phycisphaerales bacterium]
MAEAPRRPNGEDDRLPLDLVFLEYRRHYAHARIPPDLETQGSWGRVDKGDVWQFSLIYWLKGRAEPYILFEAELNKRNLEMRVLRAEDPEPISQHGVQRKGDSWERYEISG